MVTPAVYIIKTFLEGKFQKSRFPRKLKQQEWDILKELDSLE